MLVQVLVQVLVMVRGGPKLDCWRASGDAWHVIAAQAHIINMMCTYGYSMDRWENG